MIKRLLAHPRTRGLELDDPETTRRRREIVREKVFLRRIYEEWYGDVRAAVPEGAEPVLELGSGAGFLEEFLPGLVTSDILPVPGVDCVLDAYDLPFKADSLRAIVMIDVLHHLGRARDFFSEAGRCVRPGGAIVMIEPWNTTWARWVYRRLHHEPFEPRAAEWEFPHSGPLSGANGALPWIVFDRDRAVFEREFPEWEIRSITPMMPACYLLSGGVSLRSLAPAWTFSTCRLLENFLGPWMTSLGMFARIVLVRSDVACSRRRENTDILAVRK